MSMTTDELRTHWDAFSKLFEDELEKNTVLLARALIAHLRLSEATAVLEVGAGAGGAAEILCQSAPASARVVVTDLSPRMVALARQRLPEEVEVMEANSEELPFADGSFDRLLANLNLMLVPDPDRALAEAYRVLEPGGRVAWSVWGRPELSPMFTVPAEAARRVGMELAQRRSSFHLGDRDALMARVRKHGFTGIRAWYQAMMPDDRDGASFAELTIRMPRWQEALAGQSESIKAAFRAELTRLADECLAAGRPLGLDALVVVAER